MNETGKFQTLLNSIASNKKIVSEEEQDCMCDRHGKFKAKVLTFADGYVMRGYCPACVEESKAKEAALERERQEIMRRQRTVKACAEANIEPEYYDKQFSDYMAVTESQKLAVRISEQIVTEKRGNMLLLGPNGTGKTMLGSIAARELHGKIYSMYEISTMIRQSYTAHADRSELEIVSELASVPFLAIDEIGRSKGSDSELNWLSHIIDKRHTRWLPTFLMGNGHLKKFCKDGGCPRCVENFLGNDILSRLAQNTAVIILDGSDYRKSVVPGKLGFQKK